MSAPERDGWIELEAYCAKYGERKNTIHKRVAEGVWTRGVHYSSPSGGVGYINEALAAEWLAQRKAAKAAKEAA